MLKKLTCLKRHRESTVRHADKVFWLCDGKLSGGGTHDEFIAEDKEYALFWKGDNQQP
jgi:ABC-type multidrug transport system fused ATPase/permease subunit